MFFKENFTFAEFNEKIRFQVKGSIGGQKYQEEAGRIAAEARDRFFRSERKAESRAKHFPTWLAAIEPYLGDFPADEFRQTRDKFNNNTIDTLKNKSGVDTVHYAVALHYRLHMYYGAEDRELADDLDREVFSRSTFEAAVGEPVFTFEADSYYDPPPMEAPMSHPPYISAKQAEDALAADADHSIWLSPHNHFTIPLKGREKETARLDVFMRHDAPFRILPIIAPSGAGKTRLISEWMKPYSARFDPETKWEAGFLVSDRNEHARDPEPWKTWEIKKDTLIVIDYTYAFDEVVKAIADRALGRTEGRQLKVRLIVVDHVMPKVLQDDFLWGRIAGGNRAALDRFQATYLDKELPLEAEDDASAMLRSIIAAAARVGGHEVHDSVVSDALTQLDRMGREQGDRDSVRHPLFAALLGRALRRSSTKPDFATWTRRDLVEQYFSGKDRLPWLGERNGQSDPDRTSQGLYAGALVSAATLRRGINRLAARQHLPGDKNVVFQIAQRVISSDNAHEIGPFLPDILGETFLLKFFEATEDRPDVFATFIQLLSAPGEDPVEQARNFRETIARLARNLAGDKPELDDVLDSWDRLANLLDPAHFASESQLRTYTSYACADVMEELGGIVEAAYANERRTEATSYSALQSRFESLVETDRLCSKNDSESLASRARTALRFYEFAEFDAHDPRAELIIDVAREFSEEHLWTATMLAAFDGRAKALSLISQALDEDVDQTVDGWTAAILASLKGHLEVLRYLHREAGCDLNATREDGRTAAMAASEGGHLEVLRYLHRDAGCDLTAPNECGGTAAMLASQNGHLEVLRYLHRDAGCDLTATREDGWTAVMVASQNGHLEVLRYLHREAGCDLTAPKEDGWTAAMSAGQKGHLEVLRYLHREAGCDLTAPKEDGWTAAMLASQNGHLEVLRYLHREADCNLNATDDDGWTAATSASQNGHLGVLRYLHRDAGCDLHATTEDGWTAAMAASLGGQLEVLRYLHREADCDLNATTEDGWTAAMSAGQNGHLEVLHYLHREVGCDLNATKEDGRTALMAACVSGHLQSVQFLVEAGAIVDLQMTLGNAKGVTSLMLASDGGSLPIVEFLLLKGANRTLTTSDGQMALSFAENSGHADVAAALRETSDRSGE